MRKPAPKGIEAALVDACDLISVRVLYYAPGNGRL